MWDVYGVCVCLVDVSSDCLFSFPSLYSQMLYYRLPDFRGLPIFRTPSLTVRHSLPSPAIYLVILIMLIRTIFFIFCYFFFFVFFLLLPLLDCTYFFFFFNHFSNVLQNEFIHALEIFWFLSFFCSHYNTLFLSSYYTELYSFCFLIRFFSIESRNCHVPIHSNSETNKPNQPNLTFLFVFVHTYHQRETLFEKETTE